MNTPFSFWRLPLPQSRQSALKLSAAPSWIIVAVAAASIMFLLIVPLVTLLWRAGPGWMAGTWQAPTVAAALQLSLFTSTLTTILAILIGTPMAYILARYRFWGAGLLDIVIDLPMVLPPAVAGVALLVTFGRNGSVGRYLAAVGIELPFTTAAVIIAQCFVAAPFYIRAAKAGFAGVDYRLEQISATLGESSLGTFWRITLPLARNALIGGGIMTWARSLGEFGATILFAGSLSGRTQTMPLAIYAALQSDLNVALTLAAILLAASFALLALLRIVTQ
jgi:molybdate transport system permease protein